MTALQATAAVCCVLAAVGACLHVIAACRLRGHLRREVNTVIGTPPLTLWRAVKPGVPDLAGKLDCLVAASRTEDQILIGVDACDFAVCEAWRAKYPERDIAVIECMPDRAANPKIAKFIRMQPHARHEHWLLTDSEALPDVGFIGNFRNEWAECGAAALTAGYRFTGIRTVPQLLDAAPALLTLWPGLMLVRRMDFTLGACTGIRAADLRAAGGWEAFADVLAEDRELGARLPSVALSRHVLTLDGDPIGWREWLLHLHRTAVTYRMGAPLGTLGLPVLHVSGLLLVALVAGLPVWLLPVALFACVARIIAAFSTAAMLRFRLPGMFLLPLIVPLFETVAWATAWLPLPVWWSGKWRRLGMTSHGSRPARSRTVD
jgi:ceramide glucosyltransferase